MNRLPLLIVALMFSISAVSQIESGIMSLDFGAMAHFDDVSIEFVELISDSRCPKDVSCFRAGEAEVLVAIYKGGTFSHEKKLIFDASGLVLEKNVQLFSSENLYIKGLALYPYPTGTKINDDRYYLDLQIN